VAEQPAASEALRHQPGAEVATAVDFLNGDLAVRRDFRPSLCDGPLVAPTQASWTMTPGSRGRSKAAVPLCHENSEVIAGVASRVVLRTIKRVARERNLTDPSKHGI